MTSGRWRGGGGGALGHALTVVMMVVMGVVSMSVAPVAVVVVACLLLHGGLGDAVGGGGGGDGDGGGGGVKDVTGGWLVKGRRHVGNLRILRGQELHLLLPSAVVVVLRRPILIVDLGHGRGGKRGMRRGSRLV